MWASCFCVVCTVLKLEIPLMVELMVLEASPWLPIIFPSSSTYLLSASSKRSLPAIVLITNIRVSEVTKRLEGNIEKLAGE